MRHADGAELFVQAVVAGMPGFIERIAGKPDVPREGVLFHVQGRRVLTALLLAEIEKLQFGKLRVVEMQMIIDGAGNAGDDRELFVMLDSKAKCALAAHADA